jgi:hypothetical protein
VVSGRGKALMTFKPDIDPKNGKIEEPVALNGEPEFLTADPGGGVYVNLMTRTKLPRLRRITQKVAIGFKIDPVSPGIAVGAAVTIKDQRFRFAASLLTASRSILSKIGIPMELRTSA